MGVAYEVFCPCAHLICMHGEVVLSDVVYGIVCMRIRMYACAYVRTYARAYVCMASWVSMTLYHARSLRGRL